MTTTRYALLTAALVRIALAAPVAAGETRWTTNGVGTAPTVSAVNPSSGPAAGGTLVTIIGTGFAPVGTTVKIGDVAATDVSWLGETVLKARAPVLPAGTLNDVVVTNPSTDSGTLVKGYLSDFLDVPRTFLYHTDIETIFRAGITTGCGARKFCPDDPITRDAMAAFIIRAKYGGSYVPPNPTGDYWDDVKTTTFLARWMEQFGREGITTGCGASPGAALPNYCATAPVTRDAMSLFLLRGKNGPTFLPPVATGNMFCDVPTLTFLARWMERLKVENISQGCGAGGCGLPNFCPLGTVTRGEMAPLLVRAFPPGTSATPTPTRTPTSTRTPTRTRTPAPTRTPVPPPVIAGTWNGTVTCAGGRKSPVTVKFEQPGDGRSVNGSMPLLNGCFNCGASQIYARLVEALPWSITGTVSYKSVWCYPYLTYSASLSGSLEGSPVSRISVTTGPFKPNRAGSKERPGIQLELTTRSVP